MDTDVKTRLSVDEFVEWCDARAGNLSGSDEPGWELFDGVPVMQQSERWAHVDLKVRTFDILRQSIRDAALAYVIALDGLGVVVSDRTSFEPDFVVFPAGLIKDDDHFAPQPIIVGEVLSPTTTKVDLTTKLAGYSSIPTIEHYLVLDPNAKELLHYRRASGVLVPPMSPAVGRLELNPPGLSFTVEACFERS